MKFKLGDKVQMTSLKIKSHKYAHENILKCWKKSGETRPYMIVTRVDNHTSWLRFDNNEFNAMGGSWNDMYFEPYRPLLPEELFTL